MRARLKELASVDLRSLALLRICLGGILLLDVVLRARDLRAHYTDFGVLPRKVLLEGGFEQHWFSLHMGSGTLFFQGLLFLLAAVAALSLTLGYRTGPSTIVSWFLLASLQARNPLVNNGGDDMLRVVLFWCMFLPWGRRMSIDALQNPDTSEEHRYCSPASLAYLVQIALIYLCASRLKNGQPWLEGTAVYYALSIDQFSSRLGLYLLGYPALLEFLSRATIVLQKLIPICIFLPLANPLSRTLAVVALLLFHLGIGLCMHLGIFTLVAMLVGVGMLPAAIWHRLPQFKQPELLRRLAQRLPTGGETSPEPHPGTKVLVAALLVFVVCWNLSTPNLKILTRSQPLPGPWLQMGKLFRLDQNWGMFAPAPLTEDGWYVVVVELKNGMQFDLFAGPHQKVSWQKPPLVSATFPNERWRKYMMNLYSHRYDTHRRAYCEYQCRLWNATHWGRWRAERVTLYFVLERTLPDYNTEPAEKLKLYEHRCDHGNSRSGGGFNYLFGPLDR